MFPYKFGIKGLKSSPQFGYVAPHMGLASSSFVKFFTNFNMLLGNIKNITLKPPDLDLPSTGCLHNDCNCPLALE